MIEIDGSYGEGGGQILRTALSLSCLLNKPFRMFDIRKARKKPGLMPQHLTCVRAMQLLSNAAVTGDYPGSTELRFSPKEAKGGDFSFDIGTAGSTMLVLQTIIPYLVMLNNKTAVILKGGTHVPFSPSFHYIKEVFLPFLERLGIKMQLNIESYGFYPKGGGRIRAEIFPVKEIRPLKIIERGDIISLSGHSCVGNLPVSIAERQRNAMLEKIYEVKDFRCPVDIKLHEAPTPGQGTFIFLCSQSDNSVAGFTSLGERGKKAEAVGRDAAIEFLQYYSSNTALDPHMADQIVPYLSLSREASAFSASRITGHLMTNLWVTGLFHKFHYSIKGELGMPGEVNIAPYP